MSPVLIVVPLRAVLTAPWAVGSSTSVTSAFCATSSISGREKREPISSSPLRRKVTVGTGAPLSRASFRAQMPWARPVFMSKIPGPLSFSRPWSDASGCSHPTRAPAGHTVS